MTNEERKAALEAIIYAADEPATLDQLASALADEKLAVQSSIDELVASYASEERGVEIRAVAGGYKMYTKPQHHDVVRRFIKSLRPPLRLSMPALETLAVIAYKQPVTAPEISEIRGVNTSGVISTLLDKKLITTAGRKEVIGRPILYKTSKEFLMRFGLSDLDELPSLKEFEALAREALGSDEGLAETTGETSEDSLSPAASHGQGDSSAAENVQATEHPQSGKAEVSQSEKSPTGFASLEEKLNEAEEFREHEALATAEGMPSGELDEDPPAIADESRAALSSAQEKLTDAKELREEEVSATSEGMPSGELDEDPPAVNTGALPNTEAKSKTAGD
jgi:segregation and condensation protein B